MTFSRGEEFLGHYSERGTAGTLEIAGHTEVPVGELVDVEIAFADDMMVFHAQGVVKERRVQPPAGQPAGIRVELTHSEARTRDVLLDFAHGRNRSTVRRRARRFPLHVDIEIAVDETFQRLRTDDLNREGAFLLTDRLLNAGTLLAVRILPPDGGPPLKLNAEVAWRQSKPRCGIGICFLVGDPAKQQELNRLVDRLVHDQLG